MKPRARALALFERQVLVFPLLVVLLACTSFLFGGRCAAWQWWTAVAAVVLVPFARRERWRVAWGAAGLFALLLFALRCLIPPLVWDSTECEDMPVYHLPMIQLLIEGWNPVVDPMAEQITASLGLDLWGMAPLHVAFLPKTMAVFSAVAYTFIGDPLALSFPLPVVLWLGVLLTALRMFCGFPRLALVAALCFVLPTVVLRMPVDLSVAFASCGLLLTMQDALRRRGCDWFALTVWTAWMMNLKLNGVLAAFVFCALFAVVTIWRERTKWRKWLDRFAAFCGVLVLLWFLVSCNPLGTSWRSYGHPLYPFQTIDAERFPIQDLTWDLQGGNADYLEMGRIGLFAHIFLSPSATDAFYRWKLHQDDFEPIGVWWLWKEYPSFTVRMALCLGFCILLILPSGRPWAVGGLILLILVPKNMIGFMRYQPWLQALGCLAIVFSAEWVESRLNSRLTQGLSTLTAIGIFLYAGIHGFRLSNNIECKARELDEARPRIRAPFWLGPIDARKRNAAIEDDFTPRYNYLHCIENRTRLLVKELGRENQTTVEPAARMADRFGLELDWDERDWLLPDSSGREDNEASSTAPSCSSAKPDDPDKEEHWVLTPFDYWVPLDSATRHIVDYQIHIGALPSSFQDHGTVPTGSPAIHAWFVVYPKEVARRLFGRHSR